MVIVPNTVDHALLLYLLDKKPRAEIKMLKKWFILHSTEIYATPISVTIDTYQELAVLIPNDIQFASFFFGNTIKSHKKESMNAGEVFSVNLIYQGKFELQILYSLFENHQQEAHIWLESQISISELFDCTNFVHGNLIINLFQEGKCVVSNWKDAIQIYKKFSSLCTNLFFR